MTCNVYLAPSKTHQKQIFESKHNILINCQLLLLCTFNIVRLNWVVCRSQLQKFQMCRFFSPSLNWLSTIQAYWTALLLDIIIIMATNLATSAWNRQYLSFDQVGRGFIFIKQEAGLRGSTTWSSRFILTSLWIHSISSWRGSMYSQVEVLPQQVVTSLRGDILVTYSHNVSTE